MTTATEWKLLYADVDHHGNWLPMRRRIEVRGDDYERFGQQTSTFWFMPVFDSETGEEVMIAHAPCNAACNCAVAIFPALGGIADPDNTRGE